MLHLFTAGRVYAITLQESQSPSLAQLGVCHAHRLAIAKGASPVVTLVRGCCSPFEREKLAHDAGLTQPSGSGGCAGEDRVHTHTRSAVHSPLRSHGLLSFSATWI